MKKLLLALALIFTLTTTPYAAEDVFSVHGTPGGTVRVAATDSTQTLTTAIGSVAATPRAVLITVESYGVRFSFVNSASQAGGAEVGHVVAAGSSLWINSNPAYSAIKFINQTNGSNGVLQITYFY